MRLLPASASPDAGRLIAARMVRAYADGLVSVLLPAYLTQLGYGAVEIGAIVTGTLLGSAGFTLTIGLYAHRFRVRALLLSACALMVATGIGFALAHDFMPLLVIAVIGTLNPGGGDVSVFLPIEQTKMAAEVASHDLAAVYARSNVAAAAMGALGALSSALPPTVAAALGLSLTDAMRGAFLLYSLAAVIAALLYMGLREHAPVQASTTRSSTGVSGTPSRAPLKHSRKIVLELAALFTLDSFGGGFVVSSLLALWFFQRFSFSLSDVAGFFFATTILSGVSQLVSPWLAKRIGLVRTMVFTHLPANVFLILAAFMPSPTLVVVCLLLRMSLASMDVPARQAFVMSVVPPEERAAAASVTNVPRSLGTGLAPLFSGYLLASSNFGYPLLIAGSLKVLYDVLLLRGYQHHVASRPAR